MGETYPVFNGPDVVGTSTIPSAATDRDLTPEDEGRGAMTSDLDTLRADVHRASVRLLERYPLHRRELSRCLSREALELAWGEGFVAEMLGEEGEEP